MLHAGEFSVILGYRSWKQPLIFFEYQDDRDLPRLHPRLGIGLALTYCHAKTGERYCASFLRPGH